MRSRYTPTGKPVTTDQCMQRVEMSSGGLQTAQLCAPARCRASRPCPGRETLVCPLSVLHQQSSAQGPVVTLAGPPVRSYSSTLRSDPTETRAASSLAGMRVHSSMKGEGSSGCSKPARGLREACAKSERPCACTRTPPATLPRLYQEPLLVFVCSLHAPVRSLGPLAYRIWPVEPPCPQCPLLPGESAATGAPLAPLILPPTVRPVRVRVRTQYISPIRCTYIVCGVHRASPSLQSHRTHTHVCGAQWSESRLRPWKTPGACPAIRVFRRSPRTKDAVC